MIVVRLVIVSIDDVVYETPGTLAENLPNKAVAEVGFRSES